MVCKMSREKRSEVKGDVQNLWSAIVITGALLVDKIMNKLNITRHHSFKKLILFFQVS